MSFADWYSGVPISSLKQVQPSGYVCMSTVDDLSYTPSAEERSRDAAQVVVTGRRSWKTLKGKGEAVWPPYLEAALIEALEKYKPDDAQSAKALGRNPMRNRFIADYIFETTGKLRTPKQVGSRLQQLRDTCKAKKIRQLISRHRRRRRRRRCRHSDPDSSTLSPAISDSHTGIITSPTNEVDPSDQHMTYQQTVVWVTILLETFTWSSSIPVIHIEEGAKPLSHSIRLAPLPDVRYEDMPALPNFMCTSSSRIDAMDPTIAFSVSCPILSYSSFSVFLDGVGPPIHTEVVTIQDYPCPSHNSRRMHTAKLVPTFWKTLCESRYPTRYTIVQQIIPNSQTLSSGVFTDSPHDSTYPNNVSQVISIVYRFSQPEPGPQASAGAFMSMNSVYPPDSQVTELCAVRDESISPPHFYSSHSPYSNLRSAVEREMITDWSSSPSPFSSQSSYGAQNPTSWNCL